MFIRALWTTLLILLSAADVSVAGTRDPNTPDRKYLEFGKQFPSVVRFQAATEVLDRKTGEPRPALQFGSAVIIRPHWILTAAHVTHQTTSPTVVRDDKRVFPLTKIITPREYREDKTGFYDLALGYSPEDFGLQFYTPLYRGRDEVRKPITIAGYGLTGTFHTGATLDDGQKRAGHNAIDWIGGAVLYCAPTAGRGRFPLEFMIAQGDSGGGMFIGDALAGINSFLAARKDQNPDGTYGDESAFTRVSLYADWVESQIENYERALQGRATTNGDLEFAVSPVPFVYEVGQ